MRIAAWLVIVAISCTPLVWTPHNWDALGYLGNIYLIDGMSPNDAHAAVYRDVSRLQANEIETLTQGKARPMAQDQNSFTEYMPFYSIRPGYIGMAYLFHRLGVPPFKELACVSVVGSLITALIMVVWLKRYTPETAALCGACLMMVPLLFIARQATPDRISAAIALLALFLIFEHGQLEYGLIILALSILFRTDNLVLLVIVVGWHAFKTKRFAVPSVVCVAGILAALLINYASGNYGWGVLFHESFYGAIPYPAEILPKVTAAMYLHVAAKSAVTLVVRYWPLLLGLAWLCKRSTLRTAVTITAIAGAIHFILYPSAELRYYLPAVIMGAISAAVAITAHASQSQRWAFREIQASSR